MAVCRAGAAAKKVPLYKHINDLAGNPKMIFPCPCLNVINGGSHAGNKLAMQEFMIIPTGATSFKVSRKDGSSDFRNRSSSPRDPGLSKWCFRREQEAMKMGSETYHNLKNVIKKRYGIDATGVGDEGGFAPNIQDNMEGLELLVEAIEAAGYTGKIEICMDSAASEFYVESKKSYDLDFKTEAESPADMVKTGEELGKLYAEFCEKYPVTSIEDPFDQDDFEAYALMTKSLGEKVQIVGDDLLVTNLDR